MNDGHGTAIVALVILAMIYTFGSGKISRAWKALVSP